MVSEDSIDNLEFNLKLELMMLYEQEMYNIEFTDKYSDCTYNRKRELRRAIQVKLHELYLYLNEANVIVRTKLINSRYEQN